MVNISKQDTSNLSEIINQSLDVLNDISITIEALSPVLLTNYSDDHLYIEEEPFNSLLDHKKYLIEKYVRQSSFTKRIENLESAQQRMKLLMKSLPSTPQSMATSLKPQKKPSMTDTHEQLMNKSVQEKPTNNQIELEKLCMAKDQELQLKIQELKQMDAKLRELQNENNKNKTEIVELNNLVSPLFHCCVLHSQLRYQRWQQKNICSNLHHQPHLTSRTS
jgi:hypothetical protein